MPYKEESEMTDRPFRFGVVTAYARSGDEWIEKARRMGLLSATAQSFQQCYPQVLWVTKKAP